MNHASATSRSSRRLRRLLAGTVGTLAVLAATSCSGSDTETVTVAHGKVPAPTLVDVGTEGNSVGDQRIFRFDGDADGTVVHMDWIMTTTALSTPEPGVESRVTSAVFAFGGLDDTILLQGTGLYPEKASTFKVSSTLVRSIIGGTGKYRGAAGWVESTNNADGTWTHVFHII